MDPVTRRWAGRPGRRRRAVVGLVVALVVLGAGCGGSEPDAVVVDSEPASTSEGPLSTDDPSTTDDPVTTDDPISTDDPRTTDEPTTTEGDPSDTPTTSGETIPGDDFGCPAVGSTSLFPCDDDDPTDQVWHVGSCLDFDAADDSYGERPCAGAGAFVKELAEPTTGPTGECFFDHIATVDLTDEELAVSGAFGGVARPGSVWCVSDP